MKNYPVLFVAIILFFTSCTNDDGTIIPESNNLEYELVQINPDNITVGISALNSTERDFVVRSFLPNSDNLSHFETSGNLLGTIGGVDVSAQDVSADGSFDITLTEIIDGMNYFTIEIDNAGLKKYFSFHINKDSESGEINYLAVANNRTDNDTNYVDAIFELDFYSNTSFRVLSGKNEPTQILFDNLINDSSNFQYISTRRATEIIKTWFEKI